MEEVPLRVTIATPSGEAPLRGRHSTSGQFGLTSSIRISWDDVKLIDEAAEIIDPGLSRNMFMRLSAVRVAQQIINHHKEYLKYQKEELNGCGNRTEPSPNSEAEPNTDVRSAE